MVSGDLFYQSFPIILNDGKTDGVIVLPGLTDIFPPDDFEIIGRHIINPTGSGGANRAVILIVARELADVPGAPTGLNAVTGSSTGEVDLDWTAPASDGGAPITDYIIRFGVTALGVFAEFLHTPSAATAITVTGLAAGVGYTFEVDAVNASGTGPASGPANANAAA